MRSRDPRLPISFLSTFTGTEPKEFINSGAFHNLNLQLSGTIRVDTPRSSNCRSQLIVPGQLSLNVAHEEYRCVAWPSTGILTLHVAFPLQWMEMICEEENLHRHCRVQNLRPTLGLWDKRLRSSALRMADALRWSGNVNQLEIDSLNVMLAVDLISQQCVKHALSIRTKPLPVLRLRRAVSFLHEHLGENVSLSALAAEVGLSPYHFARSFKASVGVPPHQYLTAMRIDRARMLLAETDRGVTEIALLLGFDSGNHFSTAFRLSTGFTPTAFRSQFRD